MAVIDIKIDIPAKVDIPLAVAFNSASGSEKKEVIRKHSDLALDAIPWQEVLKHVRQSGCFIYTTPKKEILSAETERRITEMSKVYGLTEKDDIIQTALGYMLAAKPILIDNGKYIEPKEFMED